MGVQGLGCWWDIGDSFGMFHKLSDDEREFGA